MVRLQEQYDQALELRKRGFTYSEIAKITGVSKGTVSTWLSRKAFSKRVKVENGRRAARDNAKRISLLNKARTTARKRQYKEVVRAAETEFRHYKHLPLFVAGLMLYVGEGDQKHKRLIRITSAQANVHRIFVRFVEEFLGVTRQQVHFWLLLYPDLDEASCKRTWSKALHLKEEQFYKTQVIEGRSKKRTLHHGVGNTIIGSTVLKMKLMRWIELISKEF